MARIYRMSLAGKRLLYKVRHHRGHGVHSPFVFNLINKVIEEKLPYQRYNEILEHLNFFSDHSLALRKEDLLSFRMVNYFDARKIVEIGSGDGVNTLCLTSPSRQIECLCFEQNQEKLEKSKSLFCNYNRNIKVLGTKLQLPVDKQDCIYINLDNYKGLTPDNIEQIVALCHNKSFIVMRGIRTNKEQNKIWRCLRETEHRTVELDLFKIGIVFFDKTLYRWKYQISF